MNIEVKKEKKKKKKKSADHLVMPRIVQHKEQKQPGQYNRSLDLINHLEVMHLYLAAEFLTTLHKN